MGKKNDYSKYEDVPEDKNERLEYVVKLLKLKDKDLSLVGELIEGIKAKKRNNVEIINMTFHITPEGIARPRKGLYGFYVPNIQKFYTYMKEYLKIHNELSDISIFSECKMDCKFYFPIPSDMRKMEKFLAELKVIKCIKKPDWDNVGKSTDMLHSLWLDDALVTDARVRKYYSFKPRIEIRIVYYTDHSNSYHELCIEKLLKQQARKKVKKHEK